jgi:hypothetical protein
MSNDRSRLPAGGGRQETEEEDQERGLFAGPQGPLNMARAHRLHQRRVMRKRSQASGEPGDGANSRAPGGPSIPAPGGPLTGDVRARMEHKIGADLSGVTVNTGADAGRAATQMNARAFTVGQDIHFGHGEFAPGTREGDHLLAHELTHAVQASKAGVQRKAKADEHGNEGAAGGEASHEELEVSEPSDPAEKEADAVADRVVGNEGEDANKGGAHAAGSEGRGAGEKEATEKPQIGAAAPGVGRKILRQVKPPSPKPQGGLVGPDGKTPANQHQAIGGGARPAQVANIQPILGKLKQAIQMFEFWARQNTVPIAQTMLRQLEAAREEAQSINEDQRRNLPASQLEGRMQALTARLQAIQTMDPNYRLVSVGDLARTIQNTKQQMPVCTPRAWNCPPKQRDLFPEYQRQLGEQQDGVNSMLAATWKDNRQKFLDGKAAGGDGRSAEGNKLQKEFQNRSNHQPNTAAPHNSDQIGGGHPDPTGVPVHLQVNSSIGPQWKDRVGTVDAAVNNIPEVERLVTQMNVRLTAVQV